MTDTLEIGKRRAEELGLKFTIAGCGYPHEAYAADDIHRLLGEGVERNVECIFSKDKLVPVKINDSAGPDRADYKTLCIGTRPIAKESREEKMEQLLRKFTESRFMDKNRNWQELDDFYREAKTLLGEK